MDAINKHLTVCTTRCESMLGILGIIKANHDRSIFSSGRVSHERVDWNVGVDKDVDVLVGRVDISFQIVLEIAFECRLIVVWWFSKLKLKVQRVCELSAWMRWWRRR